MRIFKASVVIAAFVCACGKQDEAKRPLVPAEVKSLELPLLQLDGGIARVHPAWLPATKDGTADIRAGKHGSVDFMCDRASFSLNRPLAVDPRVHPRLAWDWRVDALPPDGDLRASGTDDQAAQVLVRFDDDHVVSYVWDSRAPVGHVESYLFAPVRAIVIESGPDALGRWLHVERDLLADYRQAWDSEPGSMAGLRLQSNCQHTESSARASFRAVEIGRAD